MDNGREKALFWAYRYLSYRPRTVEEMRKYLVEKAPKYRFSPDVVPEVLDRLQELNYLNDQNFIELYLSTRIRMKPRSERVLRMELTKLGISRDLLDAYFVEQPVDEEAMAAKALASRWRRYREYDPPKRFEKALSYLLRRGFSFAVSKKAIADKEQNE